MKLIERLGPVAVVLVALGLAASCSAPPTDGGSSPDDGSKQGELAVYVATYDDGHSERQYALRTESGRETPLTFDAAPEASPGDKVRVWGDAEGASLHVTRYEPLSPPHTVTSADTTFPAPAMDTYAFVLVDLGGGVNITAQQAQTAVFGTGATDKSFAEYYTESSYEKYTVSGDVVGPYTYSMTTCDTMGMEALEAQIPKTYNHYIYYFGTKQSVCAWGGLGEEGSINRPAKRTWMNGSDSCVVLMQEPGHNLGLMHGNTIACSGQTFSTTPGTSCTVTEYGDRYTTMGSGCRDDNAYERWYESWLTGCNGVRVTQSGTFNLMPLETQCPGGVQVLQVPLPATRTVHDPQAMTTNVNLNNYYVELRTNAGMFDTAITSPTVLIYVSDNVRTGNQDSVWTELLDMNPSTTAVDAITAGQTYTDPSGSPSIKLESVSAAGATVTVTVAGGTTGNTCIDGTTLSGGGPTTCGAVLPPSDAGVTDAAVAPDSGAPDGGGARDASTRDASTRDAAGGDGAARDGAVVANDAAESLSDAAGGGGEDAPSGEGGGGSGVPGRDSGANAGSGDAGRGSADSGTASNGSSSSSGGDEGNGSSSKGCSCETTGRSSHDGGAAAGARWLLGMSARRRRRSEATA